MKKTLFKHGGSYAVDLPVLFVRELGSKTVTVVRENGKILIEAETAPETIENEPEFKVFAEALLRDALKHPAGLKNAEDVWDAEWGALLKDARRGKK
ncbi:MAG TPA: hypothetical protein VNK24_02595 [Elusimicrobiota bacterium]|nr:hypothetical protein [Elusimicrobiota bacterium]